MHECITWNGKINRDKTNTDPLHSALSSMWRTKKGKTVVLYVCLCAVCVLGGGLIDLFQVLRFILIKALRTRSGIWTPAFSCDCRRSAGKDNDSQLSLFMQPKEAEQVIIEAYGEEGGVSVGVPMFGGMPDSVGAGT